MSCYKDHEGIGAVERHGIDLMVPLDQRSRSRRARRTSLERGERSKVQQDGVAIGRLCCWQAARACDLHLLWRSAPFSPFPRSSSR